MKIYAPVKDSNGVWASVTFVNGVGETDNPLLIEWFRNHGYTLEEDKENIGVPVDESVDKTVNVINTGNVTFEPADTTLGSDVNVHKPDFNTMTPNELREWMMENGYGSQIRNTRNKEKLLEILRG